MTAAGTVVVGGGLGGLNTARILRELGYDAPITLVCAEGVLPYDRPPLSKAFLLGTADEDDLVLAPAGELAKLDVDVRLGTRAVGLDVRDRRVRLAGGDGLAYDALVVATGATPNRLPILEGLSNVVHLRDLDDARRLRGALEGGARVGIVGGGFIGLEIASVARSLGCAVAVVELADEPLAPIIGTELGRWVREWHEAEGVVFRCATAVDRAEGDGRAERLVLEDGGTVDVDVVVVGVGVSAAVGWLRDAGLEVGRGLVCDERGRTSDPHVFGVGDVTCRRVEGGFRPSGHWTAATDGADAVALAILGREPSGIPLQEGYFWSDQYSRRLQFQGHVPAEPVVELVSGSPAERKFVAHVGDGAGVCAVFAMSDPRGFMMAARVLRP
jgi:3-phenylpropionate/trans-cinnamate dioxygenase ferredoxin reductase component